MIIEKINEYEIDSKTRDDILGLLQESFPDIYPNDRIYFKQIPHFRYLTYDNQILIGHVGLDYRVMSLNKKPIKVLGIIDLCVKKEYRGIGVGSNLLQEVEKFALKYKMDFILLFADLQNVYRKNGYIGTNNNCKWLKIDEHTTLGIGEEKVEELMIKQLGIKLWEEGEIDMLGYLY